MCCGPGSPESRSVHSSPGLPANSIIRPLMPPAFLFLSPSESPPSCFLWVDGGKKRLFWLVCLAFIEKSHGTSCAAPPTNQGERLHKPKGEFFICTMLKCSFFSGSVQGVRHWHKCFSMVACTIHYSLCRKTLHCIRCIQRTLLGNEPVLFRDFLLPPGAAKQYAPPSNPRLDGR